MGHQNSIVLNGKLYDAVTGKLIHDRTKSVPISATKPTVRRKKGLVMDSVVRSHKSKRSAGHTKPASHATKPKPARSLAPTGRRSASHKPTPARAHKPQRSATLMRQAVPQPHHPVKQKPAQAVLNQRATQRLERAKAIQKSSQIKRFGQHPSSHQPTTHSQAPKKSASLRAVSAQAKTDHHRPAHHKPTPVTGLTPAEKLVTDALKKARSHEAVAKAKKPHRRRLSHSLGLSSKATRFVAGSLAFLLLAGFFVYQNMPNLSMRLASSRAGFSAHQPGYQPAGFSQDKLVTYSPGKVTISFHSNSDDRQFKIVQQASNWNSQALAENYLEANDKTYQKYEAGGRTIYIYDGSNATWVNGGVWYQIEGNSRLSSEQILRIATST